MRILAALFLLAATALAQNVPPVSPEIHADGKVTFRILAPNAKQVTMWGDWMIGPDRPNFTKDDAGVWSLTVGPLEADIYAYSFSVDGRPTLDPSNTKLKPSSRSFGSSVLDMPAPGANYEVRDVPHGTIEAVWYKSPKIGGTRWFNVYIPPVYHQNPSARYPVLYLLHGNSDNQDEWAWYARSNFILDNLLADGEIEPMLVVMPFGHPILPNDLTRENRPRNTALMEDDILHNIIPAVEARYRTAPGPENRAIAGLSMGGGQSINIGLDNLDTFSYVAVFSAGVGGGGGARATEGFEKKVAAELADPETTNQKLNLLWIGCGKDDRAMQGAEQLAALLDEHKIKYTIHKSEGAHTMRVWRRYLAELAPKLFRAE